MRKRFSDDSPIVLLLFVLALFLPFEYIGSLEIAGYTVRISQILLLFVICLYPWYAKRSLPWMMLFFLTFWSINLLSLIHTPLLGHALITLAVTLGTCSLAFFMPTLLRKEHVQQLMLFILFMAVAVCLFGLYQFLGDFVGLPHTWTGIRETYSKEILGFPRMQSTFSEPLYFGNFLLLPVCVSIILFLRTKKRIYLGALSLFLVCVLLTVSRGAMLAHLVSMGLLLWWLRKRFPEVKKQLILLSVPLLLCLCWVVFLSFDRIGPFVSHVFNWFDGAAFVEREDTFTQAISLIPQHPWVGSGPGSFGPVSLETTQMPQTGWPIVNNQYLETLMENGILGFICVFGFFFTVLRKKDDSLPCIAGKCALVGVLVQYLTFSTLYFLPIWFLIGFILV